MVTTLNTILEKAILECKTNNESQHFYTVAHDICHIVEFWAERSVGFPDLVRVVYKFKDLRQKDDSDTVPVNLLIPEAKNSNGHVDYIIFVGIDEMITYLDPYSDMIWSETYDLAETLKIMNAFSPSATDNYSEAVKLLADFVKMQLEDTIFLMNELEELHPEALI